MLSAGLISAVLGTRLPGPGTIYLSQTLRFRAPVRIGDTVTATVEVTALDPARKARHPPHHLHGEGQSPSSRAKPPSSPRAAHEDVTHDESRMRTSRVTGRP